MVATYSYRAVYAKGMKRRGVIDTRKYAFLSHRLWQERLQSSTHSVQVGSWQVHSGSDGVGRVGQQVQQLGNEKDDAALTGATSTSTSAALHLHLSLLPHRPAPPSAPQSSSTASFSASVAAPHRPLHPPHRPDSAPRMPLCLRVASP